MQDHWVRSDGVQATRDDLMVALSELDYIMIKAEYSKETRESRLQNLLHIFKICYIIFVIVSMWTVENILPIFVQFQAENLIPAIV